ncbi:hypothetical protein ASB62_06425 [Chlorobium limicola]|uniref:Uncharacterized protein n=1 Tax=Chlorobium limicola TaxID=1092 RepID=A0A101JH03_CHLLI|nr:hypothetical protein ASB62_06425 [Chlorobium limicola]
MGRGQLAVGGKIVGCEQLAVGGKRSIVRGANGSMLAVAWRSMLAVAWRSIARFALQEYRFAVEDGRLGTEF